MRSQVLPSATPFSAKFEETAGTGKRNENRACTVTFSKRERSLLFCARSGPFSKPALTQGGHGPSHGARLQERLPFCLSIIRSSRYDAPDRRNNCRRG